MQHASLYRKWRPRRMDQVVGQEPVVRTLRRAIETGRVAHAYLFSGPRGTGKTSTAKVLAMGLNCAAGPTADPDGTCDSCRAIVNNSSLDVVEMDAASNRGIDEIRDLRDRVNLAPVSGRTKVYIIDEVHMLTTEAFNALLKMLEEPPEHVVFVLATTEKHKVLPTIISRCQSFDFRRPSIETLATKLGEISKAEGIAVEPEALTVIAREGRGSFRDAEGLLDQLSSFADGEITTVMVRELLGSVGPEALLETTHALHERRAADALRIVDRLSNEGRDLGQFVGELLSHLRNLMLLPHAPEVALAGVGAEERAPLEEQANAVPTAEVVRLVEALGDSLGRVRRGGDPKLELELTFLKLACDYTEPSVENLMARLERLEKAAQNGGLAAHARATPPPVPESAPSTPAERPAPSGEATEAPAELASDESGPAEAAPGEAEAGQAAADLTGQWADIIGELKRRKQALSAAVYGEARVEGFDGRVLTLAFPEDQGFYVEMAKDRKHAEVLGEVLEERIGSRPRLEVRSAGEEPDAAPISTGGPLRDMPKEEPVARGAVPEAAPLREEPPAGRDDAGSDETVARADVPGARFGAPEASGETIRSEAEVFEIMRGFGPLGQKEGG
ncbi:MAG TPA: DNA polymerase III subunit gamma/tau [Rubrobacter sp.]|nr:DNA polymerase III subunit gamma/tau [Rubrobacter sp.]